MKYLMFLLLATTLTAATPRPKVPADVTVIIKDDAYKTPTLIVRVGTTVTFINRDDDAHTVTSTSNIFDSKGLDTGGTWRHTFTKAGTYTYFCELHPFMKGTIIVKAGSK